jgi:hypothetical protein
MIPEYELYAKDVNASLTCFRKSSALYLKELDDAGWRREEIAVMKVQPVSFQSSSPNRRRRIRGKYQSLW